MDPVPISQRDIVHAKHHSKLGERFQSHEEVGEMLPALVAFYRSWDVQDAVLAGFPPEVVEEYASEDDFGDGSLARDFDFDASARLRLSREKRADRQTYEVGEPMYGLCYLAVVDRRCALQTVNACGFAPQLSTLLDCPRSWFIADDHMVGLNVSEVGHGLLHLGRQPGIPVREVFAGIAARGGVWLKGSLGHALAREGVNFPTEFHACEKIGFSDQDIAVVDLTDDTGYCYVRMIQECNREQVAAELGPKPQWEAILNLPRSEVLPDSELERMTAVRFSSTVSHIVERQVGTSVLRALALKYFNLEVEYPLDSLGAHVSMLCRKHVVEFTCDELRDWSTQIYCGSETSASLFHDWAPSSFFFPFSSEVVVDTVEEADCTGKGGLILDCLGRCDPEDRVGGDRQSVESSVSEASSSSSMTSLVALHKVRLPFFSVGMMDEAVASTGMETVAQTGESFIFEDGEWLCYRRNYLKLILGLRISPAMGVTGFFSDVTSIRISAHVIYTKGEESYDPYTHLQKVRYAFRQYRPSRKDSERYEGGMWGELSKAAFFSGEKIVFERIQPPKATWQHRRRDYAQIIVHVSVARIGHDWEQISTSISFPFIIRGRAPALYKTIDGELPENYDEIVERV